MIKSEELFNFYSHLFGMIAAIIGTVFLIDAAPSSVSMVVVAAIYGLSISFLLLASSLYYFFKRQENELSFWRKMDRLAIFFMIAGSYTPVCYFFLYQCTAKAKKVYRASCQPSSLLEQHSGDAED